MEGDTKNPREPTDANLNKPHRDSEQIAGPAATRGFRAKNLLPKARRFFVQKTGLAANTSPGDGVGGPRFPHMTRIRRGTP